jgi:basic membrane protein A
MQTNQRYQAKQGRNRNQLQRKGILATLGLALLYSALASASADLKVAIVFDKGGKDDKSFNSAAHVGAVRARDELKIQLKYVEATDDNSFEPMLRAFARKDFDLIIGVGFAQAEAVKKVASQFKEKKFAIIDAEVDLPNVRSLMFEEHEGSYLVGAIAAMASKSGGVGFIGGMDIPLIRRFEMGYRAGAQKINPKIKLVSNFVGVTGDAWNNPAKAKELALAQYNTGIDVIFAAAGASGAGLFDAAEEKKKLAIGVDSNQNWIKPGRVLTSMMKRVDVAVYHTVNDVKAGKFTGGVARYGLANDGVEAVIDSHNQALITPAMKKTLDQLKGEILSGKISVPDFYKKK